MILPDFPATGIVGCKGQSDIPLISIQETFKVPNTGVRSAPLSLQAEIVNRPACHLPAIALACPLVPRSGRRAQAMRAGAKRTEFDAYYK